MQKAYCDIIIMIKKWGKRGREEEWKSELIT